MAFILDPQTEKITFGVVSDGTHDAIAIDLASQFGVSEDFSDDFSGADNWVDSPSGAYAVNISTDVIDFDAISGSNDTIIFDLGAGNVDSTNWILRFKARFNTLSAGVATNCFFGLSDSDETEGGVTTQNHIMIRMTNTTDMGGTFGYGGISAIGGAPSGIPIDDLTTFVWSTDTDYYFELIRTSTTTYTVKVFTDSEYTNLVSVGDTSATSVNVTGLRYIKFTGINSGGAGGDIIGTIDNVQFWNAKTVPIISSLNWRARFKLDITNLDDGANAVDKQLYIGLFDEDVISGSNNAQDGYLFLLTHDNALSTFNVRTPDGQAPRIDSNDVTFTTTPAVITRYIELVRDSASQTTTSIYSDATFTTLVESKVVTGVSGSDNLKYLKLFNDEISNDTGAIDGTFDDFTFTDLSEVKEFTIDGLPFILPVKLFLVDAIIASVAGGNDLTWQYREHETNASFPPSMVWTDASRLRMFTNFSSVGLAYTLKTFRLSEIIGSSINVKWERTLGNSGQGQIQVYDGVINAESLVDIPKLGSIPNTLLGSFLSSAFFDLKTDTLKAVDIDYASATGDFITVVFQNSDGSTGSNMALFINEIEITLKGTWDFTGGLVITDVRGTQQIGTPDTDDFGYINASSVAFVPIKSFTIDARLRGRKDFTIDSRLSKVAEFTIDALPFILPVQAFLIDACLQDLDLFETFAVDSRLFVERTETFTIDGIPFNPTARLFVVDALVETFGPERSNVGDLIIRVLQENPPSQTGTEIVEKAVIITTITDPTSYRFIGKTSRIKNWIGFLEKEGIIQDDGSSPDWYRTNWSLV